MSQRSPDASRDLADIAARSKLPAELQRASGMKKLDWIIGLDDPKAFVGALAPQELYYWIRDIGKGDAYALLEFANREQVQALVDIDAWSRGELLLPRWLEWLDLALAVDIDTALEFVQAQDDETFEWLFTGDVEVHPADHDLDFVPDELAAFHSPDGMYVVTVAREHPLEERLPQLMKLMWAADEDRARVLLQQVQFELHSNVTDDMQRFRDGRLQDLGFEPAHEALEVFTVVPVRELRDTARNGVAPVGGVGAPAETTGLVRDLVLREVPAPELLGAALDQLEGAARVRAGEGLAYLVNKVFMAETGDLSRFDDLPIYARRAAAIANLGLEYLSDSSVEQAARLLDASGAELLFRAGHTLTVELSRRARPVAKRAGAELGYTLFGSPIDEAVHGASLVRPVYFEGLDGDRLGYRPFQTLDDLARVEARVKDAATLLAFFEERFGLSVVALESLPVAGDARKRVRLATLLRTAMVWALLQDELAFEPIGADELAAFARAAFVGRGGDARYSPAFEKVIAEVQRSDAPDIVKSLVDRAMSELIDAIGAVAPSELDPKFVSELFLVAR